MAFKFCFRLIVCKVFFIVENQINIKMSINVILKVKFLILTLNVVIECL